METVKLKAAGFRLKLEGGQSRAPVPDSDLGEGSFHSFLRPALPGLSVSTAVGTVQSMLGR